jgi:hypothetical protein
MAFMDSLSISTVGGISGGAGLVNWMSLLLGTDQPAGERE